MKRIDLTKRSLRSLLAAKARTLLTAAAIAVGTFALTLTLAASNGATSYVNKIISDNFDPAELIVANDESIFGGNGSAAPREYDDSFGSSTSAAGAPIQIKQLTAEDIAAIRAMPEILEVRESVSVNLKYLTVPGQKKYVGTVTALNPAQNPDLVAGSIPRPLGDTEVLLPEAFVSVLGFADASAAIGKRLTMAVGPIAFGQVPPQPEERDFTIVGVLKKPLTAQPGTELYLVVSNQAALQLNDIQTKGSDNYRKYQAAYAKVRDGDDEQKLQAAQTKLESMGYVAQSVKETQEFLNQIIGVLRGIVAAFGAIAVIASVFGIVNTMYISVLQRTREIGLMKALGMRNRDIGRLFRFEAALIGLIGGLLGSVLAYVAGLLLNPFITDKLNLGAGTYLLIFDLFQTLGLIAILIVVSTLAGWLPSRKAAKLDPIEALRTE